jgi:RecG-like helicase
MNIDELAGVGPKSAALFRDLGIETSRELLDYLPFRYEDLRYPTPSIVLGASGGEENAVGVVTHVKERRVGRGMEIVEVRLRDDIGEFTAKWIGRNRYAYGRFKQGMRLFVRGRVERTLAGATINVTQYAQLRDGEPRRDGAGLSGEQGADDAQDRDRHSQESAGVTRSVG